MKTLNKKGALLAILCFSLMGTNAMAAGGKSRTGKKLDQTAREQRNEARKGELGDALGRVEVHMREVGLTPLKVDPNNFQGAQRARMIHSLKALETILINFRSLEGDQKVEIQERIDNIRRDGLVEKTNEALEAHGRLEKVAEIKVDKEGEAVVPAEARLVRNLPLQMITLLKTALESGTNYGQIQKAMEATHAFIQKARDGKITFEDIKAFAAELKALELSLKEVARCR